jgi:isocitrate dehydrogenase kinase/phosphatase
MSDTPWYSVEEKDVFPETFGPFFFPDQKDMVLFRKNHAELMTVEWWRKIQEDIEAGRQADIFPYRQNRRFIHRYG